MIPRLARLWAFLCLALLLQHATAQSFRVIARQDDSTAIEPATETGEEIEPTESASSSRDEEQAEETEATTTSPVRSSATTTSSEPTSTGIRSDGELDDSNFKNATIPAGQLPLQPELTPGFGVAGAVMLTTGLVYTLIGIKNRFVHTFFSAAYLTALGISVLIVYIMKVPLSDALQGGYVAATILPACLLGGASVFFKELTEGLACALGGFCVSMWLLCLVPGGILTQVAPKAIFIACFTLVAFAFYFSRYTRDWALISMISFAGATVTVLGIDCFSRAGLKEFWAYVWELNENLFPIGADTYPVTKGIRVETAAIIIIFLFGIVSQIKLWRIVREQKQKRAAARATEQVDVEQQEADTGRRIEDMNARERRQWERIHGNGDAGSSLESPLSDDASEKRLRNSYAAQSSKGNPGVEVIEMSDMSEPDQHRAPAPLMEEQDKEGKVTIRVAEDDTLRAPTDDGETMDEKASTRRVSQSDTVANKRVSGAHSVTEAPDVIPLPFHIPQDDDAHSRGDRSSFATFADEDANEAPAPHRHSLAKRFSQSSGKLLRTFSQRSARSGAGVQGGRGGSSEDLVTPRVRRAGDDDGSIVATFDDSVSGDERRLSDVSGVGRKSIEITAQLSERTPDKGDADKNSVAAHELEFRRGASTAPPSPSVPHSPVPEDEAAGTEAGDAVAAPSERPKSVTSAVSTPASLTKDRLPRSLSKVALSYRTNEWAKHLSHAETPEPEQLQVPTPSRSVKSKKEAIREEAKPVNVEELQQKAEQGVPPAAPIVRSDSQASILTQSKPAAKRLSRPSSAGHSDARDVSGDSSVQRKSSTMSNNPGVRRSASNNTLRRTSNFQPIAEEVPAPIRSPVIPEDAAAVFPTSQSSPDSMAEPFRGTSIPGVVSYDSPQTLIGQREMFLRSRSQGNLLASPSELTLNMPATASRPPSEAGSLHNYAMYAAALDADDVPLSQRKEFMRHSSMMSLTGPSPSSNRLSVGTESGNANFDSHQPKRGSTLPTQSDREARLASFRSSVAQDLRSGTPILPSTGRETPFASTHSLLVGAGGREKEVQRNIEVQRSIMMGQREAEGQQKEMARRQKEWADRAFDERMRSGDLLDAHREAMRKMQKSAKDR